MAVNTRRTGTGPAYKEFACHQGKQWPFRINIAFTRVTQPLSAKRHADGGASKTLMIGHQAGHQSVLCKREWDLWWARPARLQLQPASCSLLKIRHIVLHDAISTISVLTVGLQSPPGSGNLHKSYLTASLHNGQREHTSSKKAQNGS